MSGDEIVGEVSCATAQTWHLGQVLALISLSSSSFLMLLLTYRMGVMVFICHLKGFRSDVPKG